MGVNYDEPHARKEGFSEVDVDPPPWASRPFPYMQRGFGRLVTILLGVTAKGDTGLAAVVNPLPPNSCERAPSCARYRSANCEACPRHSFAGWVE